MLTQLAVFHAPDELLVAVCAGPERRACWEWVKWLPHAHHPGRTDALGPVRLVTSSAAELESLLADVLATRSRFSPAGPATDGPHVVVVLDGGDLTGASDLTGDGGIDAVTVLDLDTPPPRLLDRYALLLELHGRRLHSLSSDGHAEVGTADQLDLADAEAVARRLAPLRLAGAARGPDAPLQADLGLPELLGLGDPESFTAEQGWLPRSARDRLRVPIGVGADGGAIELDLKESAQDGMGPHGLLIGATGSGKSELLRTLVLGLAATHSSEQLNFVLVDFKGGATFASFDRLPHTAAVITNLADALPLVDRMVDAINGELVRRQELLRRAGNFASVRDYERARAAGSPLAPLPSLLLICDEFSELLSAKPDFIDLFVQIGRLGRSLGVHLLLASQRLEEGRLRGLDTHLSYRIGLRTFSALESRTVLGVADAHELPRSPGHGYLRAGTDPLARFKAAYVSGAVRRRAAPGGVAAEGGARLLTFTTHVVPVPEPATPVVPAVAEEEGSRTLLDLLVDRLVGQGPPAHQVWLPPLGQPPALDELLGPVEVRPETRADRGQPGAARRTRSADGGGGQAVGAAPGPALAGAGRRRRARRGGRCAAERQVHRPAHADLRAGAHPHTRRGAGLLPRLRRRRAGRAARPAARGRGDRPRRPDRRTTHRRRDDHPAGRAGTPLRRAGRGVDGRVPAASSGSGDGRSAGRRPVRRRVPGDRRVEHPPRRVRRPGATRHRPGHPGPVVRAARGRHRAALAGFPPGDPGPVRLPAGAAPR